MSDDWIQMKKKGQIEIEIVKRYRATPWPEEDEMSNEVKKKFSVTYNFVTSYEAVVTAETKEEAIAKVKEVQGNDINIENAWEVAKEVKV